MGDESLKFPPEFLFGAATSSYQIEGAWNVDGKGESIWDHLCHTRPSEIHENHNGDVACDSYYRYKEDVKMVKELGMKVYRFSIAWPRILPSGMVNSINRKGIDYYNRLIDELLDNDIQPMVTMFHWELPQPLQEMGGWTNNAISDFFVEYARVLFKEFGDRVKWWVTLNEPANVAVSYSEAQITAPLLKLYDQCANFYAIRNLLQAHADVYHLYNDSFRNKQKGKVGIALECPWAEPKSQSSTDRELAELAINIRFGIFAHPIYGKNGDYPPQIKTLYANISKSRGLPTCLQPFSETYITKLKGSSDFLGLNHYSTHYVSSGEPMFRFRDTNIAISFDPEWPASAVPAFKMVPWGFRKMLNWIKENYDNPTVFVTENGFSDYGGIQDTTRVNFYTQYLSELLKAMHTDKCNVIGYIAWSLMDNFEWVGGYSIKFGLYEVNFEDPKRPRKPKASALAVAAIVKNRAINEI